MSDEKNSTVLSYGGGVNSTAILTLMSQNKIEKADLVIFADTGAEMPETYKYIERWIKPMCENMGIEFVTVGSPTLYKDCFEKKIIPFRRFRWCSDRYKIRPIRKYLKARFDKFDVILGIDAGEQHRMKKGCLHPLVDLNIDREGCKKAIDDTNLPIPVKSGCFFCPFAPKNHWSELYCKHRTLFMDAEKLEKNGQRYPDQTITMKPLKDMRSAFEQQKGIDSFFKGAKVERCVYCGI